MILVGVRLAVVLGNKWMDLKDIKEIILRGFGYGCNGEIFLIEFVLVCRVMLVYFIWRIGFNCGRSRLFGVL